MARVSPHAPDVGSWGRRLGQFHVTGVVWYRLQLLAARILPRWLLLWVAHVSTVCFFPALHRIRKAVGSNLEAVLGPCSWWDRQRRIYRTFHTFAMCQVDRWARVAGRLEIRSTFEGLEHWNELARRGGGLVIVTAHVGNWEAGSLLPAALEGRTSHVVREPEIDPRAQAMQERLLRGNDRHQVHFADGDSGLAFLLLRAVRDGGIVALQGDRPRASGRTVGVSLFGRPFDLPQGPLVLARTAPAPLLPVFVFRASVGEDRVCFRAPIAVDDLPTAAHRLAAEVEWAIRRAPHQWFCWRRLWRKGQGSGTYVPSTPSATGSPSASSANR